MAACSEPEILGPPEVGWLDDRESVDDVDAVVPTTTAAAAAATASTTQAMSASNRQPVIFQRATGCLEAHNLIVVAMTFGHDGSGRCTPACGHVP
jgi:hypothetical protein